jgi:hypothetical protein
MDDQGYDPLGRKASRTGFWAGIFLLVLMGIAIFVAFKLVASLIDV